MDVDRRLDVHRDDVGAGRRVVGQLVERLVDHQMDVLEQRRAQPFDERRPHRELRTEAAVHDVDVDDADPRPFEHLAARSPSFIESAARMPTLTVGQSDRSRRERRRPP